MTTSGAITTLIPILASALWFADGIVTGDKLSHIIAILILIFCSVRRL